MRISASGIIVLLLGLTTIRATHGENFPIEVERHLSAGLIVQPNPRGNISAYLDHDWASAQFATERAQEATRGFQWVYEGRPTTFGFPRSELSSRFHVLFSVIAASPYGRSLLAVYLPKLLDQSIPILPVTDGLRPQLTGRRDLGEERSFSLRSADYSVIFVEPETELGWMVYQMTWAIHSAIDPDMTRAIQTAQLIQEKMQDLIRRSDLGPSDPSPQGRDLLNREVVFEARRLETELKTNIEVAYYRSRRRAYDAAHRVISELAERNPTIGAYFLRLTRDQALMDMTEPVPNTYILNRLQTSRLPTEALLAPGCSTLVAEVGLDGEVD